MKFGVDDPHARDYKNRRQGHPSKGRNIVFKDYLFFGF